MAKNVCWDRVHTAEHAKMKKSTLNLSSEAVANIQINKKMEYVVSDTTLFPQIITRDSKE